MKESLAILLDWVQWQMETNEREHSKRVEEWTSALEALDQYNVGRGVEEQNQYIRTQDMLKTIENLIYDVIEEERNEK